MSYKIANRCENTFCYYNRSLKDGLGNICILPHTELDSQGKCILFQPLPTAYKEPEKIETKEPTRCNTCTFSKPFDAGRIICAKTKYLIHNDLKTSVGCLHYEKKTDES